MNIKDTIRKVLTEGIRERIIDFIGSYGLKSAIIFFGGWKIIEDSLGEDDYTRKIKIEFIQELARDYGGISVFDLNEDPIAFRNNDREYLEITYFGLRKVSIQRWNERWEDDGELNVSYENLSDKNIDDIFYMLLIHFERGINL